MYIPPFKLDCTCRFRHSASNTILPFPILSFPCKPTFLFFPSFSIKLFLCHININGFIILDCFKLLWVQNLALFSLFFSDKKLKMELLWGHRRLWHFSSYGVLLQYFCSVDTSLFKAGKSSPLSFIFLHFIYQLSRLMLYSSLHVSFHKQDDQNLTAHFQILTCYSSEVLQLC